MADLLVIVPSRGRPENVVRLIGAWKATVRDDAKLFVVTDPDDPTADDYHGLQIGADDDRFGHIILDPRGERLRLGGILNYIGYAYACEPDVPVLGFVGDDHLPRTEGWDTAVLAALHDLGSGIVYGDDLLQGQKLPTAVFMTSDIIRTLGWMVPPGLVHLYIDDAWRELGAAMGRLKYLPDVVIEHMHPAAQKASWDHRYAEVNAPEVAAADKATFDAWMAEGLPAAMAKLREAGLC